MSAHKDIGRKSNMPPPLLFITIITSGSFSFLIKVREFRSCIKAISPAITVQVFPAPAQKPEADHIMPSIPLAPLFVPTPIFLFNPASP